MPLRGSLESLARRPKDEEGAAAITHNASRMLFWLSLIAVLALFAAPFPMWLFGVYYVALGFILSWLLALLAIRNVPNARRTALLQTPFAMAAIIFFVVMTVTTA